MLWIYLMHHHCWILLVNFNFMCFSQAKKTFSTPKSDSFFARSCSKSVFIGFRKGCSPFAVNGDGTRFRQWLTLLLLCTFKNFIYNQPILFFVCLYKFMQICTVCPVLRKVKIILFFGSEKLKKGTNNFVEIFRAYPYLKPHILFYSNGLAIWHVLPNIRHIKVNYSRWSAN